MIRKGSLVMMCEQRDSKGRVAVPSNEYPPVGSLCVVITNPREAATHHRGPSLTVIKKTVDVLCDGKIFEKCPVTAFIEVKR